MDGKDSAPRCPCLCTRSSSIANHLRNVGCILQSRAILDRSAAAFDGGTGQKHPMLAGECDSRTARIDQAATVTSRAEAQNVGGSAVRKFLRYIRELFLTRLHPTLFSLRY